MVSELTGLHGTDAISFLDYRHSYIAQATSTTQWANRYIGTEPGLMLGWRGVLSLSCTFIEEIDHAVLALLAL